MEKVTNMDEENGISVVTNVYGDVCVRKARRKRQKKLVQEMMYDYANNTTLHGLPYTTRKGLTMIEKIFWLITFLASVCLCIYYIYSVWLKWKNSPVIVTVSEHLVPVSEVPFPSVTICPQTKCIVSKYNFTRASKKGDEFFDKVLYNETLSKNKTMQAEIAMLEDVSLICGNDLTGDFTFLYPRKYSDNVIEHLHEVAPDYDDVFNICSVRSNYAIACSDLFRKVVTNEGICYNLNSLAAADIFREKSIPKDMQLKYLNATTPMNSWSIEHGYTNSTSQSYPLPGKENGQEPDLQVFFVSVKSERDDWCNSLSSGYRVYVQHPTDLPQSSLYYYAVLDGQVSSMALSMNILSTSDTLKSYSAETRQCYFPDERYLKYFKIYTASNCMAECLTNITFEECGCVGFFMPYEDSSKVCTIQHMTCVRDAHDNLVRREAHPDTAVCRCLPACNSIDYEAEILKTQFEVEKLFKAFEKKYGAVFNISSQSYSKLEMYFKRPRFVSMRRSEMFGMIDFLANCGGLLGLFLGFSFLSLVELFYFVTLRLCCTLKKDLEEERRQVKISGKSK